MTVRCPVCEAALLNTPYILKQRKKRVSVTLPFKACVPCHVMMLNPQARPQGWRFWDGDGFVGPSDGDGPADPPDGS